jgi:alkylation response protein AidB-like acyl-CoA dehydrogenase
MVTCIARRDMNIVYHTSQNKSIYLGDTTLDVYGPPWSEQLISKASATRVYASDTVVDIVNKGAELLGSIAISEDFPYEKCLRDAKITQLWLGGQQICRYRIARGYYDLKNWA